MSETSRRTFVKVAATGFAASFLEIPYMNANPLDLPIGLQLYTVGHEMYSDPAGTLKAVAAAGYKQVELSPLAKTSAKDLKKAQLAAEPSWRRRARAVQGSAWPGDAHRAAARQDASQRSWRARKYVSAAVLRLARAGPALKAWPSGPAGPAGTGGERDGGASNFASEHR